MRCDDLVIPETAGVSDLDKGSPFTSFVKKGLCAVGQLAYQGLSGQDTVDLGGMRAYPGLCFSSHTDKQSPTQHLPTEVGKGQDHDARSWSRQPHGG